MLTIARVGVPIIALFLMIYSFAFSVEKREVQYKGSHDFERLKQIVGVWEGMTIMNRGVDLEDQKVKLVYKLTSGGSAIVETLFADTPHEMVSVYHDKDGKLTMTHYCMLGNQPQMDLKNADEKSMDFELAPDSKINASKEPHMHALTISFVDNNNIVEKWTLYDQGEEKDSTSFKLTRVD